MSDIGDHDADHAENCSGRYDLPLAALFGVISAIVITIAAFGGL